MGDACASEEAGSCAGTVRRAPASGAALAGPWRGVAPERPVRRRR
jgi:hypothetical protein